MGKKSFEVYVPSEGNSKAKIMFVGEAPGEHETELRQPFIGGAGNILRDTLRASGIKESDCFFTNLSKYRPPGNELKSWFKKGIPDEQRLLDGLVELKQEIAEVEPNVIVALGNYPLWFLTGKSRWHTKYGYTGIGNWRGSIIEGKSVARNTKVVAAYHPAGVMRKYSWLPLFQLDLQRARDQAAFREIRRPEKRIVIDPQGDDRNWIRDRLLNHGAFITFDIEQIGSNLLCVGMTSDKDEAYVIRTRRQSDYKFIQEILESGKPLCAQNAMFDVSMLEYWFRMDLISRIRHDTMLAAHAAYIEQPKDLGTLCSIYTEQPCYWTNVNWKKVKANMEKEADSIDFMTYNAIDAWVTHDVAEQQLADELKDPTVKKTFDFEMALLKPLWDIGRKGMKIDRDQLKRVEVSAMTTIREKGAKLSALADREIWFKNETYGKFKIGSGSKAPLLFSSAQQVVKFLFRELELPVTRETKEGNASADDFALADLGLLLPDSDPRKEVVQTIRDIRKSNSLMSKFVEVEFDKDGRMRALYSPAGTVTGRLSSRKFAPTDTGANAQNFPRDKPVRKVFIPDKGCVFFYNDLERAESLVVAKITGDPLMLEHHKPGADAHALLAMKLFRCSFEETMEFNEAGIQPKRYMGKQTRHAGNYMEGWKTFMKNVNKYAKQTGVAIDERQAKRFIGMYRDMHVMLEAWWDDLNYEVCENRQIFNIAPNRRMRHCYDKIDWSAKRQRREYRSLPAVVAYKPQSTVGDALNHAVLGVYNDPELREVGVEMLCQVHDAIGGQVPEKHVDFAMARIKQHMTVPLQVEKTGEIFTIPIEIAVGPSWGEVKKIHI